MSESNGHTAGRLGKAQRSRGRKYSLEFSYHELIHLRRCLNRGIACSEGRCYAETRYMWHFLKTSMGKIEAILREARQERKTARSLTREPPHD
jgi:hypothetical protein